MKRALTILLNVYDLCRIETALGLGFLYSLSKYKLLPYDFIRFGNYLMIKDILCLFVCIGCIKASWLTIVLLMFQTGEIFSIFSGFSMQELLFSLSYLMCDKAPYCCTLLMRSQISWLEICLFYHINLHALLFSLVVYY